MLTYLLFQPINEFGSNDLLKCVISGDFWLTSIVYQNILHILIIQTYIHMFYQYVKHSSTHIGCYTRSTQKIVYRYRQLFAFFATTHTDIAGLYLLFEGKR